VTAKLKRERLDQILVDRGWVTTRARAQAMILAGHVLVDEVPVMKAGAQVGEGQAIRLREPELKYVSRGALKLKGALAEFEVQVLGKIAIDVGASTGGFTEVLLEEGATRVHAVDVGTNQLAWKIRSDPRVKSREKYNARNFDPADFGETFDLLVMDVSFISIRLLIPALVSGLKEGADLLVLFKPQFELGREFIGEGGIVQDQSRALLALDETLNWARGHGLECRGTADSPITGTDGNREYLIHWILRPLSKA
jgi:23S rRNA (cytidine1920-2'-O)/16S rRNA (cytidine1409-2'-O)-methyltransferase